MQKMLFTLLICSLVLENPRYCYSQKNFPGTVNSKINAYVSFNGGWGLSFATAYWPHKRRFDRPC